MKNERLEASMSKLQEELKVLERIKSMRLYALSLYARKDPDWTAEYINQRHMAGYCFVDGADGAKVYGWEQALDTWPETDGWGSYSVNVQEIPIFAQLLDTLSAYHETITTALEILTSEGGEE